jgi:hypothetical protein
MDTCTCFINWQVGFKICIRFEAFSAVNFHTLVFWIMTPSSPVCQDCFGGTHTIYGPKVEVVSTSKVLPPVSLHSVIM